MRVAKVSKARVMAKDVLGRMSRDALGLFFNVKGQSCVCGVKKQPRLLENAPYILGCLTNTPRQLTFKSKNKSKNVKNKPKTFRCP